MGTFFKRHQRTVIWAVVIAFLVGGVGLFSANQSGFFGGSSDRSTGETPTSAATVGGQKISLEVFQERANQLLKQYQNLYAQMGQDTTGLLSGAAGALLQLQIQAGATSDLIREAIYVQEAKSRGIRVSKDTIDAAFAQQYAQLLQTYNLTEEQLTSYLIQSGDTLDMFKSRVRTSIETQMIRDAVDSQVAGTVQPSEDDLAVYFEKNISKYDVSEEVKAAHILVADLDTALSLKAQLAGGADFATLAKQFSLDTGSRDSGGELGWFSRGQMVAEFEDAAFSLPVGEVSAPVKTSYGYHLILVTDHKVAHTPTLAEVHDQVAQDYAAEVESARVAAWYEGVYPTKDVVVEIPLIRAFLFQEKDTDLGLAEFERLKDGGTVSDPYLSYYIGQIYETKASTADTERAELEKITAPTAEQTQRIEELRAQAKVYRDKALENYLAALEDVDADEDFLNRILVLNPDSTTATFLLGKLYVDQGNYVEAEIRFSEVLSKDPANVSALVASGDLGMRQANYTLAARRYENVLELRANDISTMLKLVSVDLALGRIDQATEMIATIRHVDPTNAKLTIAEGDVAAARLKLAVAERDTLAAQPSRSEADENLLATLGEQIESLYKAGVAGYEAGLRSGGGLDLNIKLGDLHLAAGKLTEAEREFHTVTVRSPYRADAYEGLGKVYLARGETEDALSEFRTALARSFETGQRERIAVQITTLDPTDADTLTRLARIYAEQYKWAAAIREYAKLIELRPTMEEAYTGIAEAYRWRTEYESAVDYLKQGISVIERDTAKVRLYDEIVKTDQARVGSGKPLSAVGLDALIESAKLQLARSNLTDALTRLQKVETADPIYRADEVAALIVQAGGTPASQGSGEGTP